MIITARKAKQLIRQGHARCVGHTTTAPTWHDRDYGQVYAIIERLDEQRTDHCPDNGQMLEVRPCIY